jgi:Phosphatidyl serine synthase
LAGVVFFLLFSAVHMPDGLFVRPHPVFWRISMGLTVLYGCFLVFLLFQKPSDGRALLNLLDPALGIELPERSYADDCRLYTPNDPRGSFGNLMDTLQDEFVFAHLLGWWAKTIIFRDMYITWLLSIVFELLELSLAHILPNFHECWWDHILVDLLVCNLLGMLTGFLTIRLLRMKVRRCGCDTRSSVVLRWWVTPGECSRTPSSLDPTDSFHLHCMFSGVVLFTFLFSSSSALVFPFLRPPLFVPLFLLPLLLLCVGARLLLLLLLLVFLFARPSVPASFSCFSRLLLRTHVGIQLDWSAR